MLKIKNNICHIKKRKRLISDELVYVYELMKNMILVDLFWLNIFLLDDSYYTFKFLYSLCKASFLGRIYTSGGNIQHNSFNLIDR